MTAQPVPTEVTNLDHALAYARRGWRVVPIPPGEKFPRGITAWQTEGSTDEAKITHWWTKAPDHGIGIVTGATSGLWVLDVDVADGKVGDETLAELCDAYSALPDTFEVITGSGGRHLYFAWPTDGQVVTNSASGRLGPGLDVRGEGGFIVAPPSLHASGNRYEVEASAPDHLAPAPGWLLAMLQAPEPQAPTTRPQQPATAGDRPGDRWAADTTWAQLLEPDGWTLHHVDRDGEAHWTRPGKDRRDGTSATTGYKGSDVLKVFTSSHPHLEADATYTKLGYLAATRHHGDHGAAARQLAADGWGSTTGGLDQLVGPSLQNGPAARARAAAAPPPPDTWNEPRGLAPADPLPDVPLHAYPEWIRNQIENIARQLMCDPVLPAVFALGALSVASLGHVQVAVRAGETMRSTGLYLAAAGPPASGKSPALDLTMAPVRAHEQRAMAAAADAVSRAVARRKMAEKEAQQAIDSAAATGDPDRKKLAEELAVAAHLIVDPPAGEKMTSDITPERLASLMAANAERMAIVSDESGVLEVDRYGERGSAKKLDIYLQSFTGQPVAVHRVKAPTVRLQHPLLAIVAGVQPEALSAAMADREWRTRGMGARFLTVTTARIASNTDIDLDLWDHEVAHTYDAHLSNLADQWGTWANPAVLHLHPAARARFSTWAADLRERELPGGDLEGEGGWTSKMRTSILRIAALLHLAGGHRHDQEVDADTLGAAIELGEFFIAHHVHEADHTADAAIRLLGSLTRLADPDRLVTFRHVGRGGPRGMRKAEQYLPHLATLIDAGLVRLAGQLAAPGTPLAAAAKTSAGIELHPDADTWLERAAPRDTARPVRHERNDDASRSADGERRARQPETAATQNESRDVPFLASTQATPATQHETPPDAEHVAASRASLIGVSDPPPFSTATPPPTPHPGDARDTATQTERHAIPASEAEGDIPSLLDDEPSLLDPPPAIPVTPPRTDQPTGDPHA